MTTRITSENDVAYSEQPARRSVVSETKSAFKTTEFAVFVLAVLGV